MAELQASLIGIGTQAATFAQQAQLLDTTGAGVFDSKDLASVASAQAKLADLADPATVKREATSPNATPAGLNSQITAIGIALNQLENAVNPLIVAVPAMGNDLLAAHPSATAAQKSSLTTAVNAVTAQSIGGQDDIPNLVNFVAAARTLS
jgi:hypothetical protein